MVVEQKSEEMHSEVFAPRPFLETDFSEVQKWFSLRKLVPPPREVLPKNGFIIPGIAAGFLFSSDSCVAFIDGICGNPLVTRAERRRATKLILYSLFDLAKNKGFKYVQGNTTLRTVLETCLELGCLAENKAYISMVKVL